MSASSFAPFGRVVAGYGVVGVLWILWSDALVELVFENIELLAAAQAWKGMLFVLVTTGSLFWFRVQDSVYEVDTRWPAHLPRHQRSLAR